MSQFLAVVPFVVIVITVLSAIILMDWLNNRKVGENLQQVAETTNGELIKEDGNYTLKGTYCGRDFTIFMKPRGAGKNKALYYHVHVESDCEIRMACMKRHVKSRLEPRINQMEAVDFPDEDFNMVHKLLVDNAELGQKIIANPTMIKCIKNIMEKYTEMNVKKDITLLKRYHVKLTEPPILLATLENLIKIAVEIENLSRAKV
jgi:hypothetical protein